MKTSTLSHGVQQISKSLIASYIFDWIIIILIAIVGGLFSKASPNHHPFSLADASIAFPFTKEKVSTSTLVLVGLVAPAIIIIPICLLFVPGPTVSKDIPRSLIWRRKLWEWNTAWLGLALALASAFFLTDGMKSLFGKPRPDLLSRCDPDLANIQNYAVGGRGPGQGIGSVLLVSWQICRQKDLSTLNDGFASFPSGHSSCKLNIVQWLGSLSAKRVLVSWAGLTYLTFFLCSKFAITIPYLLPQQYSSGAFPTFQSSHRNPQNGSSSFQPKTDTLNNSSPSSLPKVLRSQAAAPPTYLLVLAFIPIGAAIYISSSRYSDFRHHGFDIIFGSLMGFLLAWGSFRWYHAPIRRGAGWSWGARSNHKAWGVGLGVQGYAEEDGMKADDTIGRDIELGGSTEAGGPIRQGF